MTIFRRWLTRTWYIEVLRAALIVGGCYLLLSPSDFRASGLGLIWLGWRE
jgi:hypothetical protein